MPPRRHSKVDYLRVYPGLNDFSDAIEAIPETVVGHLTQLKEIDAQGGSTRSETTEAIRGYFADRSVDKLEAISQLLDKFLPIVDQKMHATALATRQLRRQVDRLQIDFGMIRDHEVPQHVQFDLHDPAFIEIVPHEKQVNARVQARREAREAREQRRVVQIQQQLDEPPESRSATPGSDVQPTSTRRRGGKAAAAAQAAQKAEEAAVAAAAAQAVQAQTLASAHALNTEAATDTEDYTPKHEEAGVEVATDNEEHEVAEESKIEGISNVPPVVMPLDPPPEEEALIVDDEGVTLKRKRGTAPKTSEPVYCYCQQGSFGEMVGCDGTHCEREWFHLDCIGLSALPKGQWFCEECRAKLRRR